MIQRLIYIIDKNAQPLTGIVNVGYSGLQRFVARKKSWYTLIGNYFEHPHDTKPPSVSTNITKRKN